MSAKNLWYIRNNSQVKGPFASNLVSKRILLGRIQLDDEVSNDQVSWLKVKHVPELLPSLLKKDQSDPFIQERLAAARRWADERSGSRDRRESRGNERQADFVNQRSGRERRQIEDLGEINYREGRAERYDEEFATGPSVSAVERKSYTSQSMILLLLLGMLAYAAYSYLPRTTIEAVNMCDSPPAPKVDWSNCNLQGLNVANLNLEGATLRSTNLTGAKLQNSIITRADISYSLLSLADLRGADLSSSNMIGVNLRKADLTGVDFTSSNLSYSNFTGAILLKTNFQNAILEKAIWIDGRECAAGSVGQCN